MINSTLTTFFKSLISSFITLSLFYGFAAQANVEPIPALAVKAYVLKDVNSNMLLASSNVDMRVEPASLTKVMTAYLSFKAIQAGKIKLTDTMTISQHAFEAEGSRTFLSLGSKVSVDDLLHGMIIQSGNDASIALAEGIAFSEPAFVSMMNQEAQRLGMTKTHFMNATGLPDPDHYTTAQDLVTLATALIRDFPQDYQRLYSVKEFTYNNVKQPNRNRLLWIDPNVDGMKTGHTETAGYCLIASAKRDGVRRISVVLGAASDAARATESQKLLNYGFQNYDTSLIYKRDQVVNQVKVWKGSMTQVASTVKQDLFITLPKGEANALKAVVTSTQPLIAPIKQGQVIGQLELKLNGQTMQTIPLVASNAVEVAGIFGRLWDSLKLLLQ